MPLFAGFCGGAYRTRSETISADVAINVYLETLPEGQVKRSVLIGTPGLKLFRAGSTANSRGLFSQDGRVWQVVDDFLYEIVGTAALSRGNVADDGDPVSFASNGVGGNQLALVSGGSLYILNTISNVLSAPIVIPLTNLPIQIVFIDGYFLMLEQGTVRVWYSALEDGTSWDALDFFARSQTSDLLVGIQVLDNRLWTFGSETTIIYYDGGDADNPFIPYPGSVILEGLVGPWAAAVSGEVIVWVAQDGQGSKRVVQASGYTPETISTPPISLILGTYPTLTDMELFAYEQEGHPFVVCTSPSGEDTICWDVREQQWHQRKSRDANTGAYYRWRARGCCNSINGVLVGDWSTGTLYTLDLDTFVEEDPQNGDQLIPRVRRAPYLSNSNQMISIFQFALEVENGVGLASGQGSNPEIMLAISRNKAKTWSNQIPASFGEMGEYEDRGPIWRRLGGGFANRLVFEVSMTDPVKCIWGPGADLMIGTGPSQF